jgi:hypothetical protein
VSNVLGLSPAAWGVVAAQVRRLQEWAHGPFGVQVYRSSRRTDHLTLTRVRSSYNTYPPWPQPLFLPPLHLTAAILSLKLSPSVMR